MPCSLSRFTINSLHGRGNFDIPIIDNTLILVGENGSGKTTVLNILYLFLSGQWDQLLNYNFQSLSAKLDNTTISLSRADILTYQTSMIDIRKQRRMTSRRNLQRLEQQLLRYGSITQEVFFNFCAEFGVPIKVALNYFSSQSEIDLPFSIKDFKTSKEQKQLDSWTNKIDNLRNLLDAQILYLPTYRRIEQELSIIFPEIDRDDINRGLQSRLSKSRSKHFIELVEFGMKDVQNSIKDTLKDLKDFSHDTLKGLTGSFFQDIVSKKYLEVDLKDVQAVEDSTLSSVLQGIDESILPQDQKENIESVIQKIKLKMLSDDHAKLLAHYFFRLLELQKEIQTRERIINKFVNICNSYLVGTKEFVYDSKNYDLSIQLTKSHDSPTDKILNSTKIELKHLSSGEKQIVSLFSHLYLSDIPRLFLLIDEPELSLSVPWQEKFLTDIESSDKCCGLIAMTHSPFIYNNPLSNYASGIVEFYQEKV